jgi:2-polyprenyl-6-hydroxyphenyl methylase/3-demethylubiquinone-9 3-methyltransferase
MDQKPTFEFGKNWAAFSYIVNKDHLQDALSSLVKLLDSDNLKAKAFLDIGCGSGLFSIAAAWLDAKKVIGIDIDPVSVQTSISNAQKWAPNLPITFHTVSVLDEIQMTALGKFDIVYAWGVLHHTGHMHRALEIATQSVKPGGMFVVAIYNRHLTSSIWKIIKWIYNHLPALGQRLLVWSFIPVIFLAKIVVTRQNPLRMRRGMDFVHNIIDWVGGYPYEYASIEEMTASLKQLGFETIQVRPANVPTGCNEFVSKRMN